MKLNKTLKYSLGVIGTLFLGAIGNGLWEGILKPVFHFVGIWTIELMSHIFLNYKDNIYKKASDGFHEFPSLFVMLILILVLVMLYQRLITHHPHVKDKKSKWDIAISNFIKSKKGYYFTCFISIFAIAFLYIFIVEYSYVNQIITYSEKSISIVSPYVDEHERLVLKSEFSSIKNAEDFYVFKKNLESIAQNNNLELGEFSPF